MIFRFLLVLLAIIAGAAACTSEEAAPTPTATPTPAQSPASHSPLTATPSPSETYKSGLITEDETWSGTVHITGDVAVRGATVTILPGTTVLFAAHQDDQHSGCAVPLDEWIVQHNDFAATLEYSQSHSSIQGVLVARGTPENMITFTSDSAMPDGGDWEQLHLWAGSAIEYCIVEYSRGAVDVAEDTYDSVVVSYNIMRYNLWTALTVHSSSSTVTYNEIYRSGGHQGIAIIGAGSAPHIANNRIEHCAAGIHVDVGTSPIIEDNILTNNHSGIGVLLSTAVIQRNIISSPTGAAYDFTYRGESVYFATTAMGGHNETQGITVGHSSPTISHNDISDYGKGIVIVGDSSPSITFNTISGCLGGIVFEPSFLGSPGISMNNIYKNSGDNLDLQPGFTGVLDAANNWWGTANEADIARKINDSVDDPSRGTVDYMPFLTEPLAEE